MTGLPDGRVVVLGGGGFIGSNLVQRLVRDGHEVWAVGSTFPAWRLGALEGAEVVPWDLEAGARLPIYGATTVFHLAASMGGAGWFHSDKDWGSALTNGLITNNVMRACSEAGVERLVYTSSVCALATEAQGRPLVEGDLLWGTPDARYGWEKRYGAVLCEQAPFDARVALLDTVYGPLQEHSGQRMKFPAAVCTKALQARHTGVLELWGDGEQKRTYLYVDDAVDRLIQLASHPTNPGPVQIGGKGAVTCREIANLCLELVGALDAQIVTVDGPTGVLTRESDLSKWRDVFGDGGHPPTTYREGFRQMLEWLQTLEQGKEKAA